MNKGKCYGVSVGPGDPKLITYKAGDILKSADVIFLPSAPKEKCRVYQIIKASEIDIPEDKFICVNTKEMADPSVQGERYDILTEKVSELLDKGYNVAFPALGEVCLYSTYMYVEMRLIHKGYVCENISGISSVQETANRLLISLAQGDEEVHIFPDTKNLATDLLAKGTKVFMKPKSNLDETIAKIKEYASNNTETEVYGISNCGCDNEIVAHNIDELNKLSGYMTVIIVK